MEGPTAGPGKENYGDSDSLKRQVLGSARGLQGVANANISFASLRPIRSYGHIRGRGKMLHLHGVAELTWPSSLGYVSSLQTVATIMSFCPRIPANRTKPNFKQIHMARDEAIPIDIVATYRTSPTGRVTDCVGA